MSEIPSTHREVRLKSVLAGLPEPENFEVVEVSVPVPGAGEALVRNHCFHVGSTLRMLIDVAADWTPFPQIRVGDPLAGAAVGEVVQAPPGSQVRPGDLVTHWRGWREYAAVPLAECTIVNPSLPLVAHLSQGWTAYAPLSSGFGVRPGDTVFVTSGAGAIGSMAGQIARLLGAGRVVGSTGTREKADRLVKEFGYSAAVVRSAGIPMAEQLAQAAPDGIDLVFDSVGGEQLQAAVEVARPGARFLLIGGLSGQMEPEGSGLTAPVVLDSFPLILKRIVMCGFHADDEVNRRGVWNQRFKEWLQSGELTVPHVCLQGIELGPKAVREVINGDHLGIVVVNL
ncbi:MDR family NADP-dependent oxidoreductase [Nocardia nepalensis]|uniref:MDR family NADP-dependent oxidoreductase n=1 Tax=Nocardia nepalensis TaxID=3375448 RepID=UPI003B67D563